MADRTYEEQAVRSEFGGINWGSAFFGWLVTAGVMAILVALLSAFGSAVYVTRVVSVNGSTVTTVGLISGILLLLAAGISYYAGGYVAGRMSRFDGAAQGFGVWLIGIVLTILLGVAGYVFGAKFNLFQQLNLPHVPISQGSFTSPGLISLILLVIVTLVAAVLGGRVGLGYHARVSRAETEVAYRRQHTFAERTAEDPYDREA